MTREQIIEVIATELSCSELMHQYDDFTRTVKAGVWASRIYDAINIVSVSFDDLKAENLELREQLSRTAEKLTREGIEEIAAERNAQVPVPDGELQYPFSDGRSMTPSTNPTTKGARA